MIDGLAVAILSLNEERDIAECIESAQQVSSDIFVIDSHSSDKTVDIALSLGAQVVPFRWNGQYPKKKQWALDRLKSAYSWVLLLDADERISPELAKELRDSVWLKDPEISAVDVALDYWFQGRQLRHGQRAMKRILVRPDRVQFPELDDLAVTNMWEVEGHYQPAMQAGSSVHARGQLRHEDSDGLFSYLARHNRYSDWEAYVRSRPELLQQVLAARPRKAATLARLPFQGLVVFVYGYLFKLGFLDGREGFNFAANQAFYYWQIRAKENEWRTK